MSARLLLFLYGCVFVFSDCLSQHPRLPGYASMCSGFDITTGTGTDQSICLLSFSQDRTWTNPFNTSLVYCLPDQVSIVADMKSSVSSRSYRSATEHAQFLSERAGISWSLGMFSADVDVKYVRDQITSSSSATVIVEEIISIYLLSLPPVPQLQASAVFQKSWQRLAAVYSPSDPLYREFITTFGTHSYSSGTFGGRAGNWTSMNSSFFSVNSALEVTANARVQYFQAKLGLGGGSNKRQASKEFQQQDSSRSFLEGGHTEYLFSQYDLWVPSLKYNPVLISFTLEPIYSFVPNATIAANLQQAIADYVASQTVPEPSVPRGYVVLTAQNCVEVYGDNNCPANMFSKGFTERGAGGAPCGYDICCTIGSCFACGIDPQTSRMNHTMSKKWRAPEKSLNQSVSNYFLKNKQSNETYHSRIGRRGGSLSLLPGADSIGIGFDSALGVMRGLQLINISFTQNNTWVDSDPQHPGEWIYPDQFIVSDGSQGTLQTDLFESASSYADAMAAEMGIQGEYGAFHGSASVNEQRTAFNNSQMHLAWTRQSFAMHKITLAGGVAFQDPSDTFARSVGALPLDCSAEANFSHYWDFIVRFGTHVITEGAFGGISSMKTQVSMTFTQDKDTVLEQVGFMYADFQYGTSSVNGNFSEASVSQFDVQGGNYEIFRRGNFADWVSTVYLAPVQVTTQLSRLSWLVSDPAKQRCINLTISKYLAAHGIPDAPVGQFSVIQSDGYLSNDGCFPDVFQTFKSEYNGDCDSTQILPYVCVRPTAPIALTLCARSSQPNFCLAPGSIGTSYSSTCSTGIPWEYSVACGDIQCANLCYPTN